MKYLSIITILVLSTTFFYAQDNSYINKLKKDSLIKNRFNKSKIYLGGGTGIRAVIYSSADFKETKLTSWTLSQLIEIGYFIDDKKLILIKSDIGYSDYSYKDREPVDAWNFGSMHSLAFRHYFFPNKISFFAEAGISYTNFYSEREVFTELPPIWFHVGGVYAGGGISFLLFNKIDVSPYVNYNYPLQYKDEAKQYDIFKIITGLNKGISLSMTF